LFVGEVIRASLWHINFIHKHVPVALTFLLPYKFHNQTNNVDHSSKEGIAIFMVTAAIRWPVMLLQLHIIYWDMITGVR